MTIDGFTPLIYGRQAEQVRAFLRDVLERDWDAGGGWPISSMPPAERVIHPPDEAEDGRHELYPMCSDLPVTVEALRRGGVENRRSPTRAGASSAESRSPAAGTPAVPAAPPARCTVPAGGRTMAWSWLPCSFPPARGPGGRGGRRSGRVTRERVGAARQPLRDAGLLLDGADRERTAGHDGASPAIGGRLSSDVPDPRPR